MADAREHAAVIFAALIPGRKDLLDSARGQLTPEHFPDAVQRQFWKIISYYAERTGSVLTDTALSDITRTLDAGKQALYQQVFDSAFKRTVGDDDFTWSLDQIRELAADQATAAVLATSQQILRQGWEDPTGTTLQGQEDARTYLLEALAAIDADLLHQASPEGTIQDDEDRFLKQYAQRKQDFQSGVSHGIGFGLRDLDEKVGGLQPGDLVLIAGYSSDGKSSMAVQLAWSAAVEQGRNVLFFTTETVYETTERRIFARHSKQPVFGLREGLDTKDLKLGRLKPHEEQALPIVVGDLARNPAYGKIHIKQVPRQANIATLEAHAMTVSRQMKIDLIVIDYLALLSSDSRRTTDRESLAGIIKASKVWATTFDNGRGVPIVSPWQVNRASRDAALRDGYYSSSALADTAEATNSSDVIVSLLAPADNEGRYAEVRGQVLKNRDGQTSNSLLLDVDYATSTFTSKASISFDSFAAAAGATAEGLDDLLQ
jgi:replicative DNA helicase